MSGWFDSLNEVGYKSILVVSLLGIGALAVVWSYLTPTVDSGDFHSQLDVPAARASQNAAPANPPTVVIETGSDERIETPALPLEKATPGNTMVRTPLGPFTVQVGAFRSEEGARQKVEELRLRGHDAYLASEIQEGQPMFRVCVGDFRNRTDAQASQALLRYEGIESFIRKVE